MEKIYYPRTIDSYLLEWKNERAHKPLLLRGVRQVGKSSAVRQLGKTFKIFHGGEFRAGQRDYFGVHR